MADAVNGQVLSTGTIGEWSETAEDGAKTAGMVVQFSTSCNGCMFAEGAVVQNWIETPSKTETGKYDGMLCVANWYKNQDYSSTAGVSNVISGEAVSANTNTWDYDYGLVTEGEWITWGTDEADWENAYASDYEKNNLSRQDCRAIGTLYGENADGSFNTELGGSNEMYWAWKNTASPWTFTSGYRVWKEASDPEPYNSGSAGETTYSFFDHGFTDTTPAPAEEETTDDSTSGAAALMAMATATAAFLMF
jgi:hypothetical protein